MKIVLDTNILISALIRDSATRKLIVEMDEELAYPEAIKEIHKYKEFNSIFDILLDYIELVPDDTLENAMEEAKGRIESLLKRQWKF